MNFGTLSALTSSEAKVGQMLHRIQGGLEAKVSDAAPRTNGQAIASENGLLPENKLLSNTPNGSKKDPSKSRGLSLIGGASDTPNLSFLCNALLILLFVHVGLRSVIGFASYCHQL